MRQGKCQRGGCTNVGKLTHIVFAGFKAVRGLPAGERWYCDDCAKPVLEALQAEGSLVAVKNLATGEVTVPAKGTKSRH